MSTTTRSASLTATPSQVTAPVPPLEAGDHLDQKTFHARYEAMPEHVRAELIGRVVFMPSPKKRQHSTRHSLLSGWLLRYEEATPGVRFLLGITVLLGPFGEPEPDGIMILLPEEGGRTHWTADDYLEGAPELGVEATSSTEAYDLHAKTDDYERAGVQEYLVLAVRQARAFWFANRNGKFVELPPGPDGIQRSEVFPGLWLDPEAMLRDDTARVYAVLQQGLASPEHAAWIKQLGER